MKLQPMNREEMTDKLRQCICEVTFTKKDGEERVMNCTLASGIIPSVHQPSGESKKEIKENLDVIRVFDVDKVGWRSFRVDAVKKFTHINSVQYV